MIYILTAMSVLLLAACLILFNFFRRPFSTWLKTKTSDRVDALIDNFNDDLDDVDIVKLIRFIIICAMAYPGISEKARKLLEDLKEEMEYQEKMKPKGKRGRNELDY